MPRNGTSRHDDLRMHPRGAASAEAMRIIVVAPGSTAAQFLLVPRIMLLPEYLRPQWCCAGLWTDLAPGAALSGPRGFAPTCIHIGERGGARPPLHGPAAAVPAAPKEQSPVRSEVALSELRQRGHLPCHTGKPDGIRWQ